MPTAARASIRGGTAIISDRQNERDSDQGIVKGGPAAQDGPSRGKSSPPPSLPAVSLPKGGGAIRGLGEKFDVNPVTGTATFTVPIATSPGRSGFGPQLALSYDSGAGNGAFGLGWQPGVPAITRKTDQGLPLYRDAEESDTFVLAGAEDLVPMLVQSGSEWVRATRSELVDGRSFTIDRFRPRVEGAYARIERWTAAGDGEVHWRVVSTENVTTIYGLTGCQIADPERPRRVYGWLISESYDDRGNAVLYRYKAEDSTDVNASDVHERNRTPAGRSAQRYLKRILYGNRTPHHPGEDLQQRSDWMFEVVLDYGEHYREDGQGNPVFVSVRDDQQPWGVRADPFSSYRPGFELRSYRLCRRVLLFHHFPQELNTADYLVQATHLAYEETPLASFLTGITRSGYVRNADGSYLKRSLPPLELAYSKATLGTAARDVDPESLENLPAGLEGAGYSLIDLDGDGVAGVLAEQAGAWFYKRNLSPLGDGAGGPCVRFAPVREACSKPAGAGTPGERWQWIDVSGDGQPDLVQLGGPVAGYHERAPDGGWEGLVPFRSAPNLRWDDPNVKLVDLTGDGRPDVLITQDDVLRWHASQGAAGFDEGTSVPQALDEERGPKLLLADAEQSIHLADLSGDGLTDLVRIRNGEVCYWPNLGYGRFGAKVTMDGGPWFDVPDQFDARRLRLGDVDGSGPTDLVYMARDGVRLYANQSGNGWGEAQRIDAFPEIDRASSIDVADIFGNGTSCLVWSSPLPNAAGRQMRYVDLMGGEKPHLLRRITNNLGAVRGVSYASSTRFAIEDDLAGRPWATRLPFPVLVVERVQTDDLVSRSRFITRYAYHHGYFDGVEREFRGFGLVEQWDTEELAVLTAADTLAPAGNIDPASHVPPAFTRTWFHTGAFLEGDRLEAVFETEYYQEPGLDPAQLRSLLRSDITLPAELAPAEAREAVRALKGMLLRREVYGLDRSPAEPHPYTVSEQSYTLERLQPRGPNRHAVVRTNPRETIDLQYERALYTAGGETVADPRTHHQLVLAIDDFGHVLESVSIAYGRRHPDPDLGSSDQAVQRRAFVTYTLNSYTNAIDQPAAYRGRQLSEARTYELIHLMPEPSPPAPALMRLEDVQSRVATANDGSHELPYEDVTGQGALPGQSYRRLIEHTRTLYRRDTLAGPLPADVQDSLGLPFESYSLAFTKTLTANLYGGRATDAMLTSEGHYVHLAGDGNWWIPTGQAFLSPGATDTPAQELAYARQHFFLPHRFVDPFGNSATVRYDDHDLLALDTSDALANRTTAGERDAAGNVVPALDYRVLQPALVTDPNRNRAAVAFDALGMVVGVAISGKAGEAPGDSLTGFKADLEPAEITAFASDPLATGQTLLGSATQRIVYSVDRFQTTGEPVFSATIARESHLDATPPGGPRIQISVLHGDGVGKIVQTKARAAPGSVVPGGPVVNPRWVGSGWTIVNNKGLPVKQYEPFFTATHAFEFAKKKGVGDTLFYDPLGRVAGRLHPNRTWEKTLHDAWRSDTWDANDTILQADPANDPDIGDWLHRLPAAEYLPTWHAARAGGGLGPAEQDAAQKAAAHAATPSRAFADPLGRTFLTVADNGTAGNIPARVELDIEGNRRAVTDARGIAVMSTEFDMLGHPAHTRSPDAGERWTLGDVSGQPVRAWDSRGFSRRLTYDELRRPRELFVRDITGERLAERTIYGETQGDALNHRGRLHQHYDQAGMVTNVSFDFKGNLLRSTRRLLSLADFRDEADWNANPALDRETFTTSSVYDALNRPIQAVVPHSDLPGIKVNVTRPGYDDGGLLDRIDGWLEQQAEPATLLDPATATHRFVTSIDHNARGQRTRIDHGNGAATTYEYDPLTFRLAQLATHAGANALQRLSYAHDPVGNITSIGDSANDRVFHSQQCVTPGAEYLYDPIYRLIAASGREHRGGDLQVGPDDSVRFVPTIPNDCQALRNYVETYRYDPVGNILGVKHHEGRNLAKPGQVIWNRRYQYAPDSNRLLATSRPSDPTGLPDYATSAGYSAKYTHDPHGNMTSMPHLAAVAWDHADRLRDVNLGGGEAFYAYDSDGQRVRKIWYKQPGLVEERIYLGGFELFRRRNGNGVTLERETMHIADGSSSVALIETRTHGSDQAPRQLVRYQYGNHLGSVALELDEQARVISYEEYHPYGSTAYQASRGMTETPKRYRSTAKERDEESGLYYHGARYYAPWVARWTAVDAALGKSPGANPYEYCASQPLHYIDPDGRDPVMPNDHRTPEQRELSYHDPVGNAQVVEQERRREAEQREKLEWEVHTVTRTIGQGEHFETGASGAVIGAMIWGLMKGVPPDAGDYAALGRTFAHSPTFTGARRAPRPTDQTARAPAVRDTPPAQAAGPVESTSQVPPPPGPEEGASDFRNRPYFIPGQTTRLLDPSDPKDAPKLARFAITVRTGKEIGFTERPGQRPEFTPGDEEGVALPPGLDIIRSEHTHPPGSPAIFSFGDLKAKILKPYSPSAQHAVLGYKWPSANLVLASEGLQVEPGVMETVATQEQFMRVTEVYPIVFISPF